MLPLALPFEAALFHAGPLLVTTAELALYLVLAAWVSTQALDLVAGGNPGKGLVGSALSRAAAVWLAVLVLCALAAASHRSAAVKFALRSAGGGLLFFAARDLLRAPGVARRVSQVVVAGAVISAAATLVDSALPGTRSWWQPFRAGSFTALGLSRASGPFAYPTIGAMYWEAALPLLVVALFGGGRGLDRVRPWVGGFLASLLGGLLVGAMLVSATRTALVGATLAIGAMALLGWRIGSPRVRVAVGGTLALAAALIGLTLLPGKSHSLLSQRLQWWRDGAWLRATYALPGDTLTLKAGSLTRVPVTVRNEGTATWLPDGENPVRLSYHWQRDDPNHPRVDFDGRRTPLPGAVAPGESVRLLAEVRAPWTPGPYRLRWDMICEHVTWFSGRGIPTADQTVEVSPARPGEAPPDADRDTFDSTLEDWVTAVAASRPELREAAVRLWRRSPFLGVGPDNFRHLYPEVIRPAQPGRRFEDDRLHANNLYLETLADQGLVGLAALCLLAGALLVRTRAHARAGQLLGLGAAVGVGTFFVHGSLDYFLEFTPCYALFWLLLALADSEPAPPTG